MELTSEEINALEQSREKETQIRKVLKDLVYNKRIKLNEKKVASVRKGREFSKLDYRYAVSLLDDKEIEKQKNDFSFAFFGKASFFRRKGSYVKLKEKEALGKENKIPKERKCLSLKDCTASLCRCRG